MSLACRNLVPELMDNPNLDAKSHRQALRGLRRINVLSRTAAKIGDAIAREATKCSLRTVRVLDVGCGSGDVAMGVAQRIAKRLPLVACEVVGWDMSPLAVEIATRDASHRKAHNIQFEVQNVLEPLRPEILQAFDFAYCSLFLHHFSEQQAVGILNQMSACVRCALFVDDLLRSSMGLLLARVGCHLFSRSPVVHYDGPQSVRAAFTLSEVCELASLARLAPISIEKHWPERFLMRWERPSA